MLGGPVSIVSCRPERSATHKPSDLKPLHNVVSIHLDSTHVKLHRSDMLADDLVRPAGLLVVAACLLVRLLLGVESWYLLREEGLYVDRFDLQLVRRFFLLGELQSIQTGVLDL